MGWVPLINLVVSVEMSQGEPVRSCRLRDHRDYEGLVAFVRRSHALKAAREFSFVSEAIHESRHPEKFYFRCRSHRPGEYWVVVDSPVALAQALRLSPPEFYVNRCLLLRCLNEEEKDNGADREPTAISADPIEYYRPIFVDDGGANVQNRNLHEHPLNRSDTRLMESQRLQAAGAVSGDLDRRVRYLFHEGPTPSKMNEFHGSYRELPATIDNIGRRGSISNDSYEIPGHGVARTDYRCPDEGVIRPDDLPSLKNYGHGIETRQRCCRDMVVTSKQLGNNR